MESGTTTTTITTTTTTNNNNNNNGQMSSSYSGRPGMGTSGVAGNRELLRLRNVTATRRLKADHSLTVKATKPKI
jgi:hypothetical protein